jgi:hypothetical protein
LLKYHLALIHWNCNNLERAKELFSQWGNQPDYAPLYAVRAELYFKTDSCDALTDLQRAIKLDNAQWRYGKSLVSYYLSEKQFDKALPVAKDYYSKFSGNYIIGMLYAKTLILNKQYKTATDILKIMQVLPYEGATEGDSYLKRLIL